MSLISAFLWMLLSIISQISQPPAPCHPAVVGVRFDGVHSVQVSARLIELHQEDQAIREFETDIDIARLIEMDRVRREEVMTFLQAGQVTTARELFSAALIFQHGDCLEHYQLAAQLAHRAYELGHDDAGWLYAAATDRALLNAGSVQRYGTQYAPDVNGQLALCPVGGTVTDAERAELGMATLAEMRAFADDFDNSFGSDPHPLATMARIPLLGRLIDESVLMWNCL